MPQKSNIPPPKDALTYLITGVDEFKKRLLLKRLKTRLMGKGDDAFDYSLYYAKDAAAPDITNFLKTFSITGGIRLAALIEPEVFSEEDRRHLVLFIKKPRRANVFLIMLGGRPSARLDNFAKTLPENVELVDVTAGKGADISAWVIKEFEKNKKRVNRRAASLISDNTRHDIGKAIAVIEQVSIFAGDKEDITVDDIMLFLDMPPEGSTFLLIDAINAKKPDKALIILKELLRTESSPVKLIGLLSWHIINLINVKRMLLAGVPRADMICALRIKPYGIDKLINQAGRLALNSMRKDLCVLSETDLLIKRGNIRDDYLLEMLIVKLAS
jgi:DNA polymerase III subunit delta